MSAATPLLLLLSPRSNFVVRYWSTTSVNRTVWLRAFCKAQPSCESLQKPEASFLSRCWSLCATSFWWFPRQREEFVGPVSSEFFVHRLGASAYLAVFANIKMTLQAQSNRRDHCFVCHHLTQSYGFEFLDWEKLYIYNKIFWTLGLYDHGLVGNYFPYAISSPIKSSPYPNSV